MSDAVHHPPHYKNDSSGLECIQLAEHFNSGLLQQAFQYVWRAGLKDDLRQELDKALWFIGREHEYRVDHGRLVLPRPAEAEALFLKWRKKVDSNLRAAILATLWHLDATEGADEVDLLHFYTLAEMVGALRDGAK